MDYARTIKMHSLYILVAMTAIGLCTGVPLEENENHWEWRIVGGHNAANKSIPFQVAIFRTDFSPPQFHCSGFIYNKRTIVTAAHCVDRVEPTSYNILVGTNQLNAGGVTLHPTHQLVHPKWDRSKIRNDIALVFLDEDIVFTNAVQPIPLELDEIGAGAEVFASGWGKINQDGPFPNDLKVITLLTLSNADCNIKTGPFTPSIVDSNVCTLTKRGEGTCFGDSGGPLTYRGKVVGIVSWGKKRCASGSPDVYTRISSFAPWITENSQ